MRLFRSFGFVGLVVLTLGLPSLAIGQTRENNANQVPNSTSGAYQAGVYYGNYVGQNQVNDNLSIRVYGFGAIESEVISEIREDSRILNKMIGDALTIRSRTALGVPVRGSVSASYIDGTGMMLVYKVPIKVAPEEGERKPEASSGRAPNAWEAARTSLQDGRYTYGRGGPGGVALADINPATAYNAESVETIKRQMLSALSHCGHFRNLGPGETITVYVYGPTANGRQSVIAWRVKLNEPGSGKTVSEGEIDVVQFIQSYGMGAPLYFNFQPQPAGTVRE